MQIQKYALLIIFLAIPAVLSYYIDKYRKEEEHSKVRALAVLLVTSIIVGGYYSYDTFIAKPRLNDQILSQFLKMD